MKKITEVKIEDGDYGTPAKLEVEIKLPVVVSGVMQTKLSKALDEVLQVYNCYRPTKNEKS